MTPTTNHGRARYTKGCRCGVCRTANREYQRRYRRAKPLQAVPVPEPSAQADADDRAAPAEGAVTAAVTAQLAGLPEAESRPGLAAAAIRLAELLDRPEAMPQHPAAAGRLVELLEKLTRGNAKRGRLTLVRSMTDRGPS